MLTNQEKINVINTRLLVLEAEKGIIQKEIEFYTREGLSEKIEVSLTRLSELPLKIQVLEQARFDLDE
jgi:hypothetical protein